MEMADLLRAQGRKHRLEVASASCILAQLAGKVGPSVTSHYDQKTEQKRLPFLGVWSHAKDRCLAQSLAMIHRVMTEMGTEVLPAITHSRVTVQSTLQPLEALAADGKCFNRAYRNSEWLRDRHSRAPSRCGAHRRSYPSRQKRRWRGGFVRYGKAIEIALSEIRVQHGTPNRAISVRDVFDSHSGRPNRALVFRRLVCWIGTRWGSLRV